MTPERENPPKTFVHQILGEARISKICESWDLNSEGKEIIDRILIRWQGALWNPEKKIAIVEEEVRNYQNISGITHALLEINVEFGLKRIRRLGR